jgi:hypothetical protein
MESQTQRPPASSKYSRLSQKLHKAVESYDEENPIKALNTIAEISRFAARFYPFSYETCDYVQVLQL